MFPPLTSVRTAAALTFMLAALAVCAGCHRQPAPLAPRTLRIPSGCEVNLSGEYTFKGREDWRYVAGDDGGTLVLQLVRTLPDGGSGAERSADGGTSIIVERTTEGFVGATHAVAWPSQRVACPVSFPTEVTACRDTGLVLRAVDAVGVDETCRAAPPTAAPLRDVELFRTRPAARAAANPDAGS
jgi:hypothetical protein